MNDFDKWTTIKRVFYSLCIGYPKIGFENNYALQNQ